MSPATAMPTSRHTPGTLAEGHTVLSTAKGAVHVLIVEDDPLTRAVETDLLLGEGFAVTDARDGEEGLREIERQHPDVVLLDITLPGRSGLSVLRAVRTMPPERQPKVVLVSAYVPHVAPQDAAMADGAVAKPFDAVRFLKEVERVASGM